MSQVLVSDTQQIAGNPVPLAIWCRADCTDKPTFKISFTNQEPTALHGDVSDESTLFAYQPSLVRWSQRVSTPECSPE